MVAKRQDELSPALKRRAKFIKTPRVFLNLLSQAERMKAAGQIKIFSVTRLIVSVVLGFLLPFSYVLVRIQLFAYWGRNQYLDMPIRWPHYLWTMMFGVLKEEDLGLLTILIIVANVALYGSIAYLSLLAFAIVRRKPEAMLAPPQPKPNHFPV